MKKRTAVLILLAVAASLAWAAGSKEEPEMMADGDREAIEALWKEYGQSRMDGDAARRVALHDPDAIKLPQDQPMHSMPGVEELAAQWAKQDATADVEMALEPLETVVLGDYAYTMGTYTKTATPNDGGRPSVFEGKFLTVLRKNAEGQWVIFRDSYSSSTPPPVPEVVRQYSFGTPVTLGEPFNSEQSEGSPSISADGLELYFHSGRPGGFGAADIWVVTRDSVDAEWGEPVNLGPTVNSEANEIAPSISSDGLELYFSDYVANRPGGFGKSDLWVVKRGSASAPWGEPENLGPVVNTAGEEITPEISPDGLELYFETDRPGGLGSDDLWVSRRASISAAWGEPEWLGPEINGEGMDHCPTLTGDGLTMFYDKNAAGEKIGDLMVTRRETTEADWGVPVNLGRALSGHFASDVSADGSTLYYTSNHPGGVGANDVWAVPVRLNGRPVAE